MLSSRQHSTINRLQLFHDRDPLSFFFRFQYVRDGVGPEIIINDPCQLRR